MSEPVKKTKRKLNLPGPGPGRPKGLKNKVSRDLKERIFQICDTLEADGKGLDEEARKDPNWFYTNFLKPMLPKDVQVTGDVGLTIQVIKFSDSPNPK